MPETPVLPDTAAGHAAHDLLAIAAYAAGDATGDELRTASGLAASCAACAELHHDLRAIARAMPFLPAPARPRDFRLTADQAAALRPAGWRRLLTPFAGPRFAFAAPLGGALAALGLAGILVAGGTGGIVPMSSSTAGQPAAAPVTVTSGSAAATTMDDTYAGSLEVPPSEGPMLLAPVASSPAGRSSAGGGAPATGQGTVSSSAAPGDARPVPEKASGEGPADVGPVAQPAPAEAPLTPEQVLPPLAAVALVAGLAMLGLRWGARRAT